MIVELEYFKSSGKWKYEGYYESEKDMIWKIFEEVKQMKQNNELPGLSSGSWDGYIYVSPREGYPALITP